MTVTVTNNSDTFTGNGATTAFSFTFKAQQTGDVQVYVAGALQSSGYTTTLNPAANGVGTGTGGTVTFTVAPPNLAAIIIQRNVAATQATSLPIESNLPEVTLENMFDKLTMLVQQILASVGTNIGKVLAFAAGTDPTISAVVPAPVANYFLQWDATAKFLQSAIGPVGPTGPAGPAGNGSGNVLATALVSSAHQLMAFKDTTGTIVELGAAPGANGNLLTSNGTTWLSAAPAAFKYTLSAKAIDFTANGASGTFYTINATAAKAVTLPASPADGTVYGFAVTAGSAAVTFTANGVEVIISGNTLTDTTLTMPAGGLVWLIAISGGWVVA